MMVLMATAETSRRTHAEEDTYKAAQQAAPYESRSDEAELQRLETFLPGSNEGDDETNGYSSQADVEQSVGCCALVAVQSARDVLVVGAAATKRRVVNLKSTLLSFNQEIRSRRQWCTLLCNWLIFANSETTLRNSMYIYIF